MASLALSLVGNAFGGPIGGAIGGMVGGLIDNVLFPAPTKAPPNITTSTYGNAIPLLYGPLNRIGVNMIWTSGWRKQTGKNAKMAQLKGAPPAYECDVAFALGAGPWDPNWCKKIWANGNCLFDGTVVTQPTPDANGVVTWSGDSITHKDFDSLVVYPGNNLQVPDPTIEAHLGMGNVSAYRGTTYIVINGLVGTPWGNSVPTLEILCAAQAHITLAEVVNDIIRRCGSDPGLASTYALTNSVMGYNIRSQTDGVSALQPLGLVYDFDVAEVSGSMRFQARGQSPVCTVENVRLAGHAYGDERPSFQWPNDPEIVLPKLAALTFTDPARDCQANTQSAMKDTGSAQSNLQSTVNITLTSDDARKVCDRMLWEAHIGRQTLSAQTDDRLIYVESARTFAIETPFGQELIRINRRTRGANNVIEFEATRDSPDIYSSSAPGASAQSQPNGVGLGGPVNPPVFIEPPTDFPGLTGATLLIGLSGGDGTTANDAWGGCNVYVSTDDSTGDYQLAGVQVGPATMGKLFATLAASSAKPDNDHTLSVDTSESAQEPIGQSTGDAAAAQIPLYVGGEFMTAVFVTGLGNGEYQLNKLYRALYGSPGEAHSIGEAFVQVDSSVFKFLLPATYIGQEIFFRFVSVGENLANATTYSYTPNGRGRNTAGAIVAVPATADLPAGTPVNLFTNAGQLAAQGADATDDSKPVNGITSTAVSSGAAGPVVTTPGTTVYGLSGLTPGATYYVAAGGGLTDTAPSGSGEVVQVVGVASSATTLVYGPGTALAVGGAFVSSVGATGLLTTDQSLGAPITSTGNISIKPIAQGQVVANILANATTPAAVDLSALLDTVIGNVTGDLAIRGASDWEALTAGNATDVLTSAGPGAVPAWAAPTGGSAVEVQSNGSTLTSAVASINFTTNITATASGDDVTVSATGGGGGSAGGLTLLDVATPGGTASFTFASIPAGYKNLKIVGVLQNDSSSDTFLGIQFNGDTGNNYYGQRTYSVGTGAAGVNMGNSNSGFLADSPGTNSGHFPQLLETVIPAYDDTTFNKVAKTIGSFPADTPTSSQFDTMGSTWWNNTAAVNSITLLTGVGNFAAGTVFYLYGMDGGSAPALMLLDEVVTSGSQANVAFSSIPSGYRDLIVRVRGRSDAAGVTNAQALIQFNGDTGANYSTESYFAFDVAGSGAQLTGQTSAAVGFLPAATATAGHSGFCDVRIADYEGTTFFKALVSTFAASLGTASFSQGVGNFSGQWLSAAAINAVEVILSAGNFVDGSVVSLYGQK